MRNPGSFPLSAAMHDRNYYVYIMSSLSQTLYVGVTNNLD